ncbi:thiamine phosphate synthase [Tersicoccus sp. Bi-70]|uniref:thiamine phosphate synthase n=1 Tax=Tersicoccus sp. Bi-70 TaxID=1897634 RepID=UPI00097742A2|nr:thiamine phosphate synthase [Tersicoccus sp. Bi-70]OMH36970.1 thiamine-phosphate diphosphorylase [Tersicoccus sp. Bi-70]
MSVPPTPPATAGTDPGRAAPALATARLYLCVDARREQGDLRDLVRAAYAGGVDIVQLRDKDIEGADELGALAVLREEAERAGRAFAVNDRADIARLASADVLHLGQRDLTPAQARTLLPAGCRIGLSTHDPDQLAAARQNPDVDYYCVGPVWATPTKPGRAAVGLDLVRLAAAADAASGTATGTADGGTPWFAIGGIDHHTIGEVVAAGARRVVVVRAITEASDPQDAARRLVEALPPLPST